MQQIFRSLLVVGTLIIVSTCAHAQDNTELYNRISDMYSSAQPAKAWDIPAGLTCSAIDYYSNNILGSLFK